MNRWNFYYSTKIQQGFSKDRIATLSRLLNDGADIEAKDGSQRSALHAAAARGQIEALDFLIREASK